MSQTNATSSTETSATSRTTTPPSTFVPLLDVASLPSFNPKEDPKTLAARWKLWKRSFKLYLVAKGVTRDEQKTALLLNTGGLNLQELYYTLVSGADIRPFTESIELLDNYFAPRLNIPFERHRFRQMEQASSESVDQFVCRLRQKAIPCDFTNVDEAIRDQLIERCRDPKLRRKFLEKANATLKDLQDVARVYEAVEMQVKAMDHSGPSGQVNTVLFGRARNGRKEGRAVQGRSGGNKSSKQSSGPQEMKGMRCFRCNHTGHMARDRNCPARNKKCSSCGEVGHIGVRCKTKEQKPPVRDADGKNAAQGKAYQVGSSFTGPQDYYAFAVGAAGSTGDSEVDLKVGGVLLSAVLIDSSASCNRIDRATWEMMKQGDVKGESKKTNKKLIAYGQREPIEVIGTFVSEIVCEANGKSCVDEFTVIEGPGKSLLGKETAMKLNVLRVGPFKEGQVCSLTAEGYGADIREEYADVFKGCGKAEGFAAEVTYKR